MSHTLALSVKNSSSHTLKSYSICHSWNGHNTICKGDNLAKDQQSASVEMTSGYTQYDWFTVQLDFDVAGVRQADFYCNSSYDENKCLLEVYDDHLDVRYYDGDTYKTGCNNKHYSGQFADEQNQTDPAKHIPQPTH